MDDLIKKSLITGVPIKIFGTVVNGDQIKQMIRTKHVKNDNFKSYLFE